MRICIVNEFFYPDSAGGTGAVLSGLARTLKDNYDDIEIDVITSHHLYRGKVGTKLPRTEAWDGIRIHRLSTPKPRTGMLRRLTANFLFSSAALNKLL